MTDARHPHTTHHRLALLGLGVLVLFALPGASAIYVEGEAPQHSGSYVQADIAPPHDPLLSPLNLTIQELANLSSRAADATRAPGTLLNMTSDEEAGFQALVMRLEQGGHDGVQVNDTGYRFAIAMAEIFATGTPDSGADDGDTASPAPPAHEPTDGDASDAHETGESSGLAIGSLTLLSAGAMYWVRRLA